ncbi:iron-sulfur assembly protein IscA-like 2, mitochondrial [Benincasa hispida]|uniref:iron-sulfur assembly protein IscA-like 2, mitochondrial n=1 Tax=Benincasa hispida TaxID=102211 RepID=UPI0018FF8529|nr:iron-sulfur assembly protein IscA-like 2, mitochondrial [Benincasa hispida]
MTPRHQLFGAAIEPTTGGLLHFRRCTIQRMKELQDPKEEKILRLSIEIGGCSGSQYVFDLDGKTNLMIGCMRRRELN